MLTRRAALPGFEVSSIGTVFFETVGHDRFTLSGSQDHVAEANEAA